MASVLIGPDAIIGRVFVMALSRFKSRVINKAIVYYEQTTLYRIYLCSNDYYSIVNIEIFQCLAGVLTSPLYLRYTDSKLTGTAIRQLLAKELGNVLIPPFFADQKRIVAKRKEIMPLYERLK